MARLLARSLWAGAILLALDAAAQRVIEMRGFKYAEYYDAPEETRIKTRLQGGKAQPQPGGFVLVTTARLETFRKDGLPELVVETPECTHSSTGRVIYSSGPLLVKTADGGFSIRGEGFLYQQTNSTLIISNNVETIANPELLTKASEPSGPGEIKAASSSPMRILSRSFRYSADEGAGIYSGDVQVSGTNLALTSGNLSLKLPVEERRLHEIVASEKVQMDYAGMRASGERAVYNVDTQVAEVTGQPSWSSEGRQGRADSFTIDRTNRLVLARGNAWMRMEGQSLAADLLPNLSGSKPPGAPADAIKAVEVRSASYDLFTNNIVFEDGVTVTEFAGADVEGRLDCKQMSVTFAGTNQVEKLVAKTNVVITRGEGLLAADEAIYTGTNSLLELRGSPSWKSGARQGKGDSILVDGQSREMHVKGNASMRIPAEFLRQQAEVRRPGTSPSGQAQEQEWAQIFSEDYLLRADRAQFRGGVYITHPQVAWSCERLAVDLPAEGDRIESILAEQQVAFNFLDASGQRIQGRSDNAEYTYQVRDGRTNELMHLTGQPVIETTNGVLRNRVITYDLSQNKLFARGRYSIRGTAPALGTNTFRFPK